MIWRSRHGPVTAIPTGILMAIAGLSAFSFLFISDSEFPHRLHAHLCFSLLLAGAICLLNPSAIPPAGLGALAFGICSAMIHGLVEIPMDTQADLWVMVGAAIVAAGSGAIVAWSIRARPDVLSRCGFNAIALGTAGIAVGRMASHPIEPSPVYVWSTAFSAGSLLLLANAIMRLRRIV